MKKFRIYTISVALLAVVAIITANLVMLNAESNSNGEYRVEIERAVTAIENGEAFDVSDCKYISAITSTNAPDEAFYNTDCDYAVRKIGDEYYRFDYISVSKFSFQAIVTVNCILVLLFGLILTVLIYVEHNIIKPFNRISDVPYELSKGNLTVPLKESKNRYFGKFIWGTELLRDKLEQQKNEELRLQKEKKTLVLSLSHDIKTPLSAIKLSSQALARGLYSDLQKQKETAESIGTNADKIESYVGEIIKNSKDDFLNFKVNNSEFYLKSCIDDIKNYYRDKLVLTKTELKISDFNNYLIKGDVERSVEVMQNVIENALKYGDGKQLAIDFDTEEDCVLVKISNSGSSLSDSEMLHLFESFWRGSNSQGVKGSGLGLYICRRLMQLMGGEIYAEQRDGLFSVALVFCKA